MKQQKLQCGRNNTERFRRKRRCVLVFLGLDAFYVTLTHRMNHHRHQHHDRLFYSIFDFNSKSKMALCYLFIYPPSYAVLSNVKNHTSMCNFPVLWLKRKSLKMCYLKAGWLVAGLSPGCSEAIWKTRIQLAPGRSVIQAMTCMHTCCLKGTWHAAVFKPHRVHSWLLRFLV